VSAVAPPPGFGEHGRSSPFFDLIGPLWSRQGEAGLEFALAIDERHVNARGLAHGGVLAALADVSLGYAAATTKDPPAKLVTASLAIDFADSVAIGETLVATTDVQRAGRRLGFANCYLRCDERRVARASGVFATLS
jgi:uncharacterized protein (TIGR00369 family)